MPKQGENRPVNDGQLHQISAEIGGLKTAVEMMVDRAKSLEEQANSGRRALHEKFEMFKDEVGLQIAGLSIRADRVNDALEKVKEQIKIIEPSVTAFNNKRREDIGAKRLGKYLWMAMTASAGVIGYGIHEFLGYLKH